MKVGLPVMSMLNKLLAKSVLIPLWLTAAAATDAGIHNVLGTGFLILPHLLTNFEIQKYYQNESKFNFVYSRNKLPKVKDETYVIHLDEYKLFGTLLVAIYVKMG